MKTANFDEGLAKEVEKELNLEYPNNQWSKGYVSGIIELCCEGEYYFAHHAGAFERYLVKLGLYRHICPQCKQMFFTTSKDEDFCASCELEEDNQQ